MPVGVPKIGFLTTEKKEEEEEEEEEEKSNWVDLYTVLYRNRTLFLCQEVDDAIGNHLMGLMAYLTILDPIKKLFLFIHSPGGSVLPGVGIYDTMQMVKPPVHTVCVGVAASMASFILMGGEITERLAFPHARVMMHQPMSSFLKGVSVDFTLDGADLLSVRDSIIKGYVQRTGKPAWVIMQDLERDVFMSATEAKAYGIVDIIAFQ